MHNDSYSRYQGLLAGTIVDPGNAGKINMANHGDARCFLKTAAAETRTLSAGSRAGQKLTLAMDTNGGDCVVTVTNGVSGLATITFNDIADTVTLETILVGGALKWQYLVNRGATIA